MYLFTGQYISGRIAGYSRHSSLKNKQ